MSVLADPSSDPPPPPAPAAEAGDDTEDEDLSGDVWSGVTSDQRVTVPDTRTSGDSGAAVQPGGGLSTTGWSLPRRQPVALQEEPVHRPEWRTPWPPSEDIEADDPKTSSTIPGLEAIGGFRAR